MTRQIPISLSAVWLVITTASAQPDTLWTQTFGGDNFDCGYSVQQTSDGGYIIVGETNSYAISPPDIWLIKVGENGIEEWSRLFDGFANDHGLCVRQTNDGGYIITGDTYNPHTGYDVWLIKTDTAGIVEWSRTFGGNEGELAWCVQQTNNGGYIISGMTDQYGPGPVGIWLIKTDANGLEEWDQIFGDQYGGYSVLQTADGGYIVIGYTYTTPNNSDALLIKTDAAGVEEWRRTFGGDYFDTGKEVQLTEDGGYIIVGGYGALNSLEEHDFWLIKTDADGNEEWNQVFGGPDNDMGSSVKQTDDGGYIVVGSTESFGAGEYDIWLIKTDAGGNEEWSQTLGTEYYDTGSEIQLTNDGGYIVIGTRESAQGTDYDFWLLRFENITDVTNNVVIKPLDFRLSPPYPNPFNPTTTISFDLPVTSHVRLDVFDINGRNVGAGLKPARFNPGHHQITFDGSGFASGIYIYRLTAGGFTTSGKMVLMK